MSHCCAKSSIYTKVTMPIMPPIRLDIVPGIPMFAAITAEVASENFTVEPTKTAKLDITV